MNLYTEPEAAGGKYRKDLYSQVKAAISRRRRKADTRRKRFFQPDCSSVKAYSASIEDYRRQFVAMLGWPLTLGDDEPAPRARLKFVAEDDLGKIYRLRVEALPGLEAYGLLFLPSKGKPPYALAISQHGGGGTPEYCSSFFDCWNYNHMSQRLRKRGLAVFAPQQLNWAANFGPAVDDGQIDLALKQIGGSVAALGVRMLQRSLDYLAARKDIDAERIGMIGLSWGAFYTLVAAAADTRIRVALPSGFFNNRKIYLYHESSWSGAAETFLDAEIAALVCPRALYIEVGKLDTLFAARHAAPEAAKVAKLYEQLGIANRFVYHEHKGGHELGLANDGINFLCKHLRRR